MQLGRGFTAVARRVPRLAAGGDPLHPTPRPVGAGVLEGKQVGRGFTAARRQASRLAGLVCSPCLLNRKDRRRATGPPARHKTQRGFETTLGFCVAKISTLHQSIPSDTICVWITPITEEKINPVFLCCEASPAASKHPKRRYLSLPSANCGRAERR